MKGKFRVEMLANLRTGDGLIKKGTILDMEKGPLPKDVQAEVGSLKKGQTSNRVIRLLPAVLLQEEEGGGEPKRGPGRPKTKEPDSPPGSGEGAQ